MGQATTSRFTGLSTGNAQVALLGAVSLAVVSVAVALVAVGVTSGEVAATLLFLPVFAAGFLGGRRVGYAGAVVATLVYVALRRSDLSSAGLASAGVLALTRAGAYVVVGHVGALAQAFMPDSDAGSGAGRPRRAAASGAAAGRGIPVRPPLADATGRPAETRWDQPWNQPWDAEYEAASAPGEREAVLAGVGSPAGRPYGGDDAVYGAQPPTTSMSGAWPPEPPPDPWRDDPRAPGPSRGHDAPGTGAWDDGGSTGWQSGHGWQAEGAGQPPSPSWQGGDEARPLEDDSWAAVQQSWRQQHGVPVDDDATVRRGQAADRPGWTYEPPAPGGHGWEAPPAHAGRWSDPRNGRDVPPGHSAPGWDGAPSDDDRWGPPPANGGPAAPPDPWADAAPTGGTWPQSPPAADDGWPPAPAAPDPPHGGWPAPEAASGVTWAPGAPPADDWARPAHGEQEGWGALSGDAWPTTGQTEVGWDDPAAGRDSQPDPWATAAPPAAPPPAWPAAGAFDTTERPDRPGDSAAAGASARYAALPAVDPETGLWTAKFLRDRLAAERARSRRTGHPFSLVLVQVPDGPLAQLPYRRQLTLLRELGYQFVAGGVVDHLVHVPDQAQHWFAVILPDTDRSGAQVLERRLLLGIGGYLSSRGLRLHDLESASLTAPDDDPAMGAIWEGLIGPDESGPGGY